MLLIIILSLYPGIEILEGLYSVSLDALNAYNTRGKSRLNRGEIPCIFRVSEENFHLKIIKIYR